MAAFDADEGIITPGSRGFGHQIASDYLKSFEKAMRRHGITVKDQQLACAPFRSPEGQDYFVAMNCAANSAFANRQVITHHTREAFTTVFGSSAEELGMQVVYDVAHNIAKVERYAEGDLVVHRKGSTRAFGPGRPELPELYRRIGQPVICGGSMETGSYLLAGTEHAMHETFGSTMHGSGRMMSRAQAKKTGEYQRINNRAASPFSPLSTKMDRVNSGRTVPFLHKFRGYHNRQGLFATTLHRIADGEVDDSETTLLAPEKELR